MNCKPGEMAVIVNAPHSNGVLVEVLSPHGEVVSFGHCWNIRSLGSRIQLSHTRWSQTAVWPDRMLRPMGPRPPLVDGRQVLVLPVRGEVIS